MEANKIPQMRGTWLWTSNLASDSWAFPRQSTPDLPLTLSSPDPASAVCDALQHLKCPVLSHSQANISAQPPGQLPWGLPPSLPSFENHQQCLLVLFMNLLIPCTHYYYSQLLCSQCKPGAPWPRGGYPQGQLWGPTYVPFGCLWFSLYSLSIRSLHILQGITSGARVERSNREHTLPETTSYGACPQKKKKKKQNMYVLISVLMAHIHVSAS